jgi:hypothetical protein
MKKSSNSLINELSFSQIENLTRVTKETIAFDLLQSSQHIFTPADLWNIQRNAKPRTQRRFL